MSICLVAPRAGGARGDHVHTLTGGGASRLSPFGRIRDPIGRGGVQSADLPDSIRASERPGSVGKPRA